MKKIKRLAGSIILFFCGFVAIAEIMFIQILIEEPKDIFTIIFTFVILVIGIIAFFLIKLALRLLNNSTYTDSIDEIGT